MRNWVEDNEESIKFSSFILGFVVLPAILMISLITFIKAEPDIWNIRVINASGSVVYEDEVQSLVDEGEYIEFIERNTGKNVKIKIEDKTLIKENILKTKFINTYKIRR